MTHASDSKRPISHAFGPEKQAQSDPINRIREKFSGFHTQHNTKNPINRSRERFSGFHTCVLIQRIFLLGNERKNCEDFQEAGRVQFEFPTAFSIQERKSHYEHRRKYFEMIDPCVRIEYQ